MTLVSVQNPAVLELDPVIDLFDRAFSEVDYADGDDVRTWLAKQLPCDRIGCFIWGSFASRFSGLSIVAEGDGPLAFGMVSLHFYSDHDRETRLGLWTAVNIWAEQRGHRCFYQLNQSGRSDADMIALMERYGQGKTGRVFCSVIEYGEE